MYERGADDWTTGNPYSANGSGANGSGANGSGANGSGANGSGGYAPGHAAAPNGAPAYGSGATYAPASYSYESGYEAQYAPIPPAREGASEDGPHVQYRSPSGEYYPSGAAAPAAFPSAPPNGPVVDITPGAWDPTAAAAGEPAVVYPMRNRAGTASLVLGCLALVCTGVLFVLFPLGLILAVIAVVLGRRGRRRARYGFASNGASAKAGLTLGLVSILLGGLLTALTVWLATTYDMGAARDCIADSSTGPGAAHCVVDVIDAG